ncbi:MAG: extracellular solute-binding protein [Acutalibacteraceae bacterium]
MKFKRILALILASLMCLAVFAGCNGKEEGTTTSGGDAASADIFNGEDNIKLKVWGPDASIDLLTKQCEAFKEEHSDKTIEIEVVAQGESDAGTNVINDADAAADVFGFACDQINKLVTAGCLAPVFNSNVEDVTARNSEASITAATLDNKLYAYPETADNGYYLVYDKRVVSAEDAKTLEGVLAACKKAGKKFIMDAGNGYYSCMFTFTGGMTLEGLTGKSGDTQVFNDYDEDKVVASMKAFATLFHDYADTFDSQTVDKVVSGFAVGNCGAGIDGSWDAKVAQKALGDNYGVAKLPTINIDGEDTQIRSIHGYKLLGVNAASKFPYAAQALANYLSDEECQQQRVDELMWGPSNLKVQQSDSVKNNAAVSAILEQAEYAQPQINVSSKFWSPIGNLGNKLFGKANKYDDATLKKLLKNTVSNVIDE